MRADHDAQHEDDYFWIGWKWFEFHAKQRMEAFKFFLTIVGAALTISSGFLQTKFPVVSTAGSVIALAVCLIFWQIDRRSLQLIEIGEKVLEQRWAERGELTDLNPVTRSALRSADGIRFKHALAAIYFGAAAISFAMFVASIIVMTYKIEIMVPQTH